MPLTRAVMWFRRDLRLGDNPALLEAARRRRRAPALRARPGAVGSGRAAPPGLPRRLAARARRLAAAAAGRAVGGPRRPGAPVVLGRAARSARAACTSPPTSGPTATGATSDVEQALAERRHRAGAHRLAVRRGAGPGDATARATPTRSSRRSRRPGPSTAGAARSTRRPASPGWPSTTPTDDPRPGAARTGSSCPRPASRRRARRWREFLDERARATTTTDRDRPGRRRHLADVGAPEVGRDPPAHDAGRPRPAPVAGRGDLPQGAGLAGVLRRRALPPARDRAGVPPPGVRADARTTSPARASSTRGSAGRTGFPIVDAGMRQLRATGWMHNRVRMIVASFLVKDLHLEWQHGARHFMQLARRRRPRLQPARLAVDGRLRHRRGAVLPGLQPDHPGREVRPGRRATCAARCPSWPTCRDGRARTLGRTRTVIRTVTRSGSSTTPASGSRLLTGWRPSARNDPRGSARSVTVG